MSSRKQNQLRVAKNIAACMGIKPAASYLAANGWSIDAARYILLGL